MKQATKLGARTVLNTRVEGIEERDGIVTVMTPDREYRARHVVVSVGPWLGAFLLDLTLPVEVARQVLAWYPVRNPGEFQPERFPVFIHEVEGAHLRYGFPTLDNSTVKVAIHHEGDVTTADAITEPCTSVTSHR